VKGGGRFELPAYLSNGVIGLRVLDVPLMGGLAMISGYSGEHLDKHIEAALRAPYPLAGTIGINGVTSGDAAHCIRVVDQKYDFGCGELTTRLAFNADGVTARVEVLTFCSRQRPTVVCQQLTVTVDKVCALNLGAGLSSAEVEGRLLKLHRDLPGKEKPVDTAIRWQSPGGISTCGLATVTTLDGVKDCQRSLSQQAGQVMTCYSFCAEPGQRYRLRQLTSVVPSALHLQPEMQATRVAALAAEIGFDKIQAENRAEWSELWKGRIKLVGADRRWQALADAAFYYLGSSAHASAPASTSIFGLATWKNYHYYYGHVMWDIETFVVPVIAMTQPHAARSMLEYRFNNIAGARSNARLFGRRGLQFPWESGRSSGQEAAPLPGSASWHEDHVSLGVALAFAFYADVTGDRQFLLERAWPVLSGVAEWVESRAARTERGFEILRSMGIAEREQPSDNTAFTNMSAKLVLRKALQIGDRLGMPARTQWGDFADGIVLPERDGAIISHDRYREDEEKGATPDPLMGVFPLNYPLTKRQERATLDLYLAKADDYVGSPMLSAFYGVWAARTGDRKLAAKLLNDGYGTFAEERFMQTLEYRRDRFPEQPIAGPFFANIAAFLMSLLLGFPGLSVGEGEVKAWGRRRVVLPDRWEAIEVERLWMQGRQARLSATQGSAKAVLEFY
jgi:hypothetical protein